MEDFDAFKFHKQQRIIKCFTVQLFDLLVLSYKVQYRKGTNDLAADALSNKFE